jgi:hypothetical protein
MDAISEPLSLRVAAARACFLSCMKNCALRLCRRSTAVPATTATIISTT